MTLANPARRDALQKIGLGAATAGAGLVLSRHAAQANSQPGPIIDPSANNFAL